MRRESETLTFTGTPLSLAGHMLRDYGSLLRGFRTILYHVSFCNGDCLDFCSITVDGSGSVEDCIHHRW